GRVARADPLPCRAVAFDGDGGAAARAGAARRLGRTDFRRGRGAAPTSLAQPAHRRNWRRPARPRRRAGHRTRADLSEHDRARADPRRPLYRRRPRPRGPGRLRPLTLEALDQRDVGLLDRVEAGVPGIGPVPPEAREIVSELLGVEEAAAAGIDFVAGNTQLDGRQPRKLTLVQRMRIRIREQEIAWRPLDRQ